MELSLTIPTRFQVKKIYILLMQLKKNFKTSRRVYQSLFVNVADSFIEYIHMLVVDEIQQLDDDLKANGWGTKSLLES